MMIFGTIDIEEVEEWESTYAATGVTRMGNYFKATVHGENLGLGVIFEMSRSGSTPEEARRNLMLSLVDNEVNFVPGSEGSVHASPANLVD